MTEDGEGEREIESDRGWGRRKRETIEEMGKKPLNTKKKQKKKKTEKIHWAKTSARREQTDKQTAIQTRNRYDRQA